MLGLSTIATLIEPPRFDPPSASSSTQAPIATAAIPSITAAETVWGQRVEDKRPLCSAAPAG